MKMNDQQRQGTTEQNSPRSHVLRDILIVGSPIVVLGAFGNSVGVNTMTGGALINLGYVLMIVIGNILLRHQDSSWRFLGLSHHRTWLKTILYGIGSFIAAVIVFVVTQGVIVGILTAVGLPPQELDQSRFDILRNNDSLFILMLVLAWTTIAFGEEMFYRAFLISRMVDGTHLGKWTAIVIAGLIFGIVHFSEGPVGVVSNGAFGLLFGWIYLRSNRNLWITIVGHGLLNSLRFTLVFLGAS